MIELLTLLDIGGQPHFNAFIDSLKFRELMGQFFKRFSMTALGTSNVTKNCSLLLACSKRIEENVFYLIDYSFSWPLISLFDTKTRSNQRQKVATQCLLHYIVVSCCLSHFCFLWNQSSWNFLKKLYFHLKMSFEFIESSDHE